MAYLLSDYLLSGIASNTDRARYYSFYCWALWHIPKTEPPRRYSDFIASLRRRDAAVALATIAADPKASPVGVTAAKAHWNHGLARKEFDCDFRVLPSQALGPYGQYYSGSLSDLGLTERQENGVDQITQGPASRLADLVHAQLARTPYVRNNLFKTTTISLTDLRRSKDLLSVDAITSDIAKSERKELITLLFALGDDPASTPARSLLRRHTLAHILHVVAEYGRRSIMPTRRHVDRFLVYPVYYYDIILGPAKRAAVYTTPRTLLRCHRFWRQFCLHQYVTRALELLFCGFLDVISQRPSGLSHSQAVDELLGSGFSDSLKRLTGHACRRPADLLAALHISAIPNSTTAATSWKQIPMGHRLSEALILDAEPGTPSEATAHAMALLAVLYSRWRNPADDAFTHVALHAGPELWAGALLPTLDSWLTDQTTWTGALTALTDTYVLAQHDRVMFEKGRLQSRWLQRADGVILKEQDYEPVLRNSRHPSATSLLTDLGLLRVDSKNGLGITAEGTRVLEQVLERDDGAAN